MYGQYPVAATSAASPARSRRRFLTQRVFEELTTQVPSEVSALPTSPGEKGSKPAPFLPIFPRKANDSPEASSEFEVETHISDSSELPSSASVVAAMQLEMSGSPTIMSEIQRLQRENLALRSENAELKKKPSATECTALTDCSPAACTQNLRCGAPLRYLVVASPVGRDTSNFELSFDSADAADLRRCRKASVHFNTV